MLCFLSRDFAARAAENGGARGISQLQRDEDRSAADSGAISDDNLFQRAMQVAQESLEPERKTEPAPSLDDRVRVVRRGSSSRDARIEALSDFPWDELSPEDRTRAAQIVRTGTLFRELPTLIVQVEPEVYNFFAAHPDMAVGIWRAMEISKFQLWQTGQFAYQADDGEGSTGALQLLYRKNGRTLVICEGMYKSPFLAKPIRATALFHVQTKFARSADDRGYAKHTGHLYVTFPSQTVETAAKIISPISNLIIDRNFKEISLFLHMMSLAMAKQPGWVERIADRLDGPLEERRSELIDLTARMFVLERKRESAQLSPSGERSAIQVLPPLRTAGLDPPTPAPAGGDTSLEPIPIQPD